MQAQLRLKTSEVTAPAVGSHWYRRHFLDRRVEFRVPDGSARGPGAPPSPAQPRTRALCRQADAGAWVSAPFAVSIGPAAAGPSLRKCGHFHLGSVVAGEWGRGGWGSGPGLGGGRGWGPAPAGSSGSGPAARTEPSGSRLLPWAPRTPARSVGPPFALQRAPVAGCPHLSLRCTLPPASLFLSVYSLPWPELSVSWPACYLRRHSPQSPVFAPVFAPGLRKMLFCAERGDQAALPPPPCL